MIVAIHQPNYWPWLGYFAKMARADAFVLLDDVQFSKNSYINRVQIKGHDWLTIPVSYHLGDPINRVQTASGIWRAKHLNKLRETYRRAPHFDSVFEKIEKALSIAPPDQLAMWNVHLIETVWGWLGLRCRLHLSSMMDVAGTGDDRLLSILNTFGPGVSYLSGKGGANYQDPAKFEAAGIPLIYTDFKHPTYEQGGEFQPGLSVLDALFNVGVEATSEMVCSKR